MCAETSMTERASLQNILAAPRRAGRLPALAAGLAALAAAAVAAASADAADTTPAPDVRGLIHVCSSCHGPGGRSINATFPRLAGQQKDYLETQLKAFRGHTRADPHAQTYMWGMAARLTDAQIAGVAAYYASQPPVPGEPSEAPGVALGREIFTKGIPDQNVPACMGCHGDKGQGNGVIPRLAGQHSGYIERQLEAFASKERANEIMHQTSKGLTPAQIRAVAAYARTL
jgi:cytochrome c553